jgi:GNAT superfamily N-acetyltransferase
MVQRSGSPPQVVLRALIDLSDRAVLDSVDGLIMQAYGMTSRMSRVERFISVQPGGWVVATSLVDDEERVVGCGGCIAYPDAGFGWIGLIGVDPTQQGKGIGRIVTQWLIDHLASLGCASVLDASRAGGSLYEQMGFVDHGLSRLMLASDRPLPNRAGPTERSSLVVGTHEDLIDLYAYDRERFGADRSSLLKYVFEEYPERCLIDRNCDATVRGFAIAQGASIGPFVADDEVSFDSLLAAMVHLIGPDRANACVPPGTRYLERWMAAGFTEARVLRRQHLGIRALPGQHQLISAQISFGEG